MEKDTLKKPEGRGISLKERRGNGSQIMKRMLNIQSS